jgi:hypothetical protein
MVAYIIVPKGAATPHLDALRVVATRQAKNFGCRWSRVRRGDDIVFIFKGDKGDEAANLFALAFEQSHVGLKSRSG